MKTLKVLKYFIAFIILANIQLVANSQMYYPLVGSNKIWSNLLKGNGQPPPITYNTNFIKFEGDTLIGLHLYKKVYQAQDDSTQTNWLQTDKYIREDSSHKVFLYSTWFNTEGLIYDFGASVGDTITIGIVYTDDFRVNSIDSVFIYDKYRKRFWLGNGESWIEGIGSICGVLESGHYLTIGGWYLLLCYYENDTLKFLNPDYNSCYISNVNIDATTKDNYYFELYPNPPDDQLYFKTNLLNNVSLQFFDVLGNNILFKNIKNEDHLYLDKSIFHSGIYLYQVKNNGIIVKTGKLIIQ